MRLGFRRMTGGLLALGAVGLLFALSGCGGSGAPTTTAAIHPFELVSSALPKSHVLPKKYTCNPKVGVPPLGWEGLPANTADLALVVYFVNKGQPEPQAALTGLKPTLSALKPGVIPPGATIAANSKVICPTAGFLATYFIRLYALRAPLKLAHGANVDAVVSALPSLAIGVGSLEVHFKR
jgi:phosphatidylethanolamine-binding protein (PEBP) family uncharacterized protein